MSRKFLVTIVLILFLLPVVSYYYLQSGLTWRKKAQAIMSGSKPFPEGVFLDQKGAVLKSDILENHVTLVSFLPCTQDDEKMDVLEKIYKQFEATNKAGYILLDSCAGLSMHQADSLKKNWHQVRCLDSIPLCYALKSGWPAGKSFALVDRKGIIRSYYAMETKEERRTLLEHMALLLPRERQEEVELKRGEKK